MVIQTCSALPLVSMGSVNAEIAQMTHTDEKRHRAPMKEAFIRTCRQKTVQTSTQWYGGLAIS